MENLAEKAKNSAKLNNLRETMNQTEFSSAADTNKSPILEVLQQVLPHSGVALEIASGTGQHVHWFASHLPKWTWQPSDANPDALASIRAYTHALPNVRAPVVLDVAAAHWLPDDLNSSTAQTFDAIYCANMLHISPWASSIGLMQGSARHLSANGVLITYGPYLEDEVATTASNLAFDQSLRARNAAWGIRRREALEALAGTCGLQLAARYTMPVNNLTLVWARAV